MALTRILSGTSSSANPLVSASMAPLRVRVKQGSRHWMRADDRAEINDAPALGAEPLDRLLHHENRAEHVDVVVDVKTLFGDIREGAEAENPGVVDEDVESSERGIHFFEKPCDICGLGHVGPAP